MVICERTERLTAENTDLKEDGDKMTVPRNPKAPLKAQAHNAKSMEQLAVEQAEKKLVEQNLRAPMPKPVSSERS